MISGMFMFGFHRGLDGLKVAKVHVGGLDVETRKLAVGQGINAAIERPSGDDMIPCGKGRPEGRGDGARAGSGNGSGFRPFVGVAEREGRCLVNSSRQDLRDRFRVSPRVNTLRIETSRHGFSSLLYMLDNKGYYDMKAYRITMRRTPFNPRCFPDVPGGRRRRGSG